MDKKENEAYDRAIKRMENIGIDACNQSQIIAVLQLEIETQEKEINSCYEKITNLAQALDGSKRILADETTKAQKRIEELQDQLRIARNSVQFSRPEAVTQESTLGEIIKATAESGYNISISLYKSEEENSND